MRRKQQPCVVRAVSTCAGLIDVGDEDLDDDE
jgi:hypothetical protein